MLYFDTSFLIPLFIEEETSTHIERFLQTRTDELAISYWTKTEFSSALARHVRMGLIDAESALRADAQFDALSSKSFRSLLPTVEDFELARRYVSHHESGLRAGDALHLAIAATSSATAIYTLDKKLAQAGHQCGVRVNAGIRVPLPSP
jgi:predicted nucleic acid-binding protein